MLRDLLQSEEFQKAKSKLSFAVGKDIAGKTVVADIAKMPHPVSYTHLDRVQKSYLDTSGCSKSI